MAKFYGRIIGKGDAKTATGTAASGIGTEAMSAGGIIAVRIWADDDGAEQFEIGFRETSERGGELLHVLARGDFGRMMDACRHVRDAARGTVEPDADTHTALETVDSGSEVARVDA